MEYPWRLHLILLIVHLIYNVHGFDRNEVSIPTGKDLFLLWSLKSKV